MKIRQSVKSLISGQRQTDGRTAYIRRYCLYS